MIHRVLVHIAVLLTIIFFIAPSLALAANPLPGQIVPEKCNQVGGCQSVCDLATVAQNVLNTGIYIAVFLSAVLFAWAGWLVVDTLMRTLVGNGGSFGPWNKICQLFIQQVSAFV